MNKSTDVLKNTLTLLYKGVLIADRFSIYAKFQSERVQGLLQYCWSHIIRQAKTFSNDIVDTVTGKPFNPMFRMHIGTIFRLYHAAKRGRMTRDELKQKAAPVIKQLRELLERNQNAGGKLGSFCIHQLQRWPHLFVFIDVEGVEPTNNLAERCLRHGVIWRKISYCTRSVGGQLLRA